MGESWIDYSERIEVGGSGERKWKGRCRGEELWMYYVQGMQRAIYNLLSVSRRAGWRDDHDEFVESNEQCIYGRRQRQPLQSAIVAEDDYIYIYIYIYTSER